MIAVLFVGAPILQIVSSSAAVTSTPQTEGSSQTPSTPYLSSLSDFRGRNWDWSSYADKSGFVNVIVSQPDDLAQDGQYVLRTSAAMDSARAVSVLRSYETGSYSLAFHGFSARVDLQTLNLYASGPNPAAEVYPDLPVNATVTDNVQQIGADQVWAMTDSHGVSVRGTGIVVAVIDTGVDYTHPDLGGGFGPSYKVIGGYDFYNHDNDPMDDNGHGTHVAGIIAANGNITGVAPDAKLLAYKCLGSDGSGSMSNVILGIEAAMDPNGDSNPSDHANIISMSLGGAGDETDPICQAVKNAIDAGIVVVVAAGNSGPGMGTVASPGVAPEAITVGAINETGCLAPFSSRGTPDSLLIKPEISAPGVDILSTVPRTGSKHSSPSGYASLSGTSMATPHVSGAAALLLQMHPDWTPDKVKSALIQSSSQLDESLWQAGAGGLWVPSAVSQHLFVNQPLISYGLAGGESQNAVLQNQGQATTLITTSFDMYSISADGSRGTSYWSNVSSVSPSYVVLYSGSEATISIAVSIPGSAAPEGYYEGAIQLTGTGGSIRIPFGFVLLSKLTVHVLDVNGNEVFDPYGGVWIWNVPTADVAVGVRGDNMPAPPATFMIPSGEYSIHAAGHQLLYTYDDPYLLSGTITVGRLQNQEITLRMADAKQMMLNLATDEGKPIYVKDYRVFCRYVGQHNVSFHLTGSDYSITGSEVFTLPTSKTVYVSDTTDTVGVSIAGFSYTSTIWDFMSRNWQHWYEFTDNNSNEFYIESSADLQYLLAWEFSGVDSSTPTSLDLNPAIASVYDTKYDIPGSLRNVWGDWGTHLAIGGDSTFYVRRDTDTSLNPFFSGMTRRTIVQGVWSEPYFYGNLFEGYFVRPFYMPDYSHRVRADTLSDIYLPDRNYLSPIDGLRVTERLGMGPYYPSVRMANTNDSLVLFHPLLRDQSGADVGGMYVPSMRLYRNGGLTGIYQLSEYLARTNAERLVDLSGSGVYTAEITYSPTPEICNNVTISLHFTVPSTDLNPPSITGLAMPQCFVAGASIPVRVSAKDDVSLGDVELLWKPSSESSWRSLTVTQSGQGLFDSVIQTSPADESIDLDVRVFDLSGNYLEYVALAASKEQIPVFFDLAADTTQIGYRNGDAFVVLTGRLTDASDSPLYPSAAVPLEMTLNGRKIGMILDEYVGAGSHTHNGTIRFEWHFNPANVFKGPNETADIDVAFDLGIYEPVHRTVTLSSVYYHNSPPVISLVSPANDSLIPAGQPIDLQISDDGAVNAEMRLDGKAPVQLQAPWDIDTSQWVAGDHVLDITATDDQLVTSTASFTFHVDRTYPVVRILSPTPGSIVPKGWTLTADVSDDHLDQVTCSLDNGAPQALQSPYALDMTGWSVGNHSVVIEAVDLVGHRSSDTTHFEIVESTVTLNLVSPENGDVVHSGVPIVFSVLSIGVFSSSWEEYGSWHLLGVLTSIPTAGWAEGLHIITINSTDSLGGWCELDVSLTIDDTCPIITLVSPANQSFVSPSDKLTIRVVDDNFNGVSYSLWGLGRMSSSPDVSILLVNSPGDGYFTVDMSAIDKAGNEARSSFVFAMDSSAPALYVQGVMSGDAIHLGQVLTVVAQDVFLSYVTWSADSGVETALEAPYNINTSTLSAGWHSLRLAAADFSGKSSILNISLYIDITPPIITTVFPASVTAGSSFNVTANITDDYGVRRADLYYELKGGGFGSVQMYGTGSTFRIEIERSISTWNGMSFYIRACDSVGNWAESGHTKLSVISAPSDNGVPPGPGRGWSNLLSWFFTVPGLAVAGASAVIVVLAANVFRRRRRLSNDREDAGVSPMTIQKGADISHKTLLTLAIQTALPRAVPFASSPSMNSKLVVSGANQKPTEISPPSKKPRTPSLLDAIPVRPMKISPDSAEAEEEVDYGALIERELIIPGLRQSVFSQDVTDLERELSLDLDSRDQSKRFPKDSKGALEQ